MHRCMDICAGVDANMHRKMDARIGIDKCTDARIHRQYHHGRIQIELYRYVEMELLRYRDILIQRKAPRQITKLSPTK